MLLIEISSNNFELKVMKKIGEGSFGEVYQIKDISTNQVMAIKTIDIKSDFNNCYKNSNFYLYRNFTGFGKYIARNTNIERNEE